jgi:hypothetical protein
MATPVGRPLGSVMKKRTRRRPAAARDAQGAPWLIAGVAVVFVLKLVVMLQLKDHVLTQPDAGLDTTAYVGLADRVLAGDIGLGPGLYFLSPLYIYFLAAVLAIGHSFTAVRLVQIALGTGAVALVFITAEQWFDRRRFAAALTLTGSSFYESLFLQTALDPFLTAAHWVCRRWVDADDRRYALLGWRSACRWPAEHCAPGRSHRRAARATDGGPPRVFHALVVALVPVTPGTLVVSGDWSPTIVARRLDFYIATTRRRTGPTTPFRA